VRAGAVGLGTWSVSFAYIGWEDPNHATIIENLYTLTIQPEAQGCWVLVAIGRLVHHPWVWAEQFGRLFPA
jgi:hypothetical protein